jgi:glycosyltransferase involved in cell wall biosynthesis
MKKICIDARMINHSGIGTYVRNLLIRLQHTPYQISIIADPASIPKCEFIKTFDIISLSAPIYSIEEQIKLPFLIPSCDLFWSPHYNIPLAPIRAKKRVVTICDVNHLAFIDQLSFLQKTYAKGMIQQAVARSHHIFTISHFSSQEIAKYTAVPEDKITTIHLGVDRSHFYPRHDQILLGQISEKYHLPDKFILFVSNLAPHKNIKGLLLAWEHVIKDFPEWKLVIAGKKMKNTDCQAVLHPDPLLAKEVIFLGQVDYNDLPLIYENAHAMVLPSFYEGFGLTPLEAMSCGCPVVVSRAASLPEIFEEDAIYVDPYNPKDIAQGLKMVISNLDLHRRLKASGLERCLRFNWDKTVKRHLEIIEGLL